MNSRELRAMRKDKAARKFAAMAVAAAPEPFIAVDGLPCPLSEFVEHNADDPDVVKWANSAKVGDAYPAFVPCVRVS